MNKKILALAVVVMTLPVFATAQSVYKWTDENGVTHFGDRQPTGKQSESVSIRTGKPSDNGDSRMSPQQRVQQIAEEEAENAQSEKISAAEGARQKQRVANCKTARSNLSLLRGGSRIRVEENGERRYLTPEEISEKREQFEEIAELNCSDASKS
jgi:hypothetical protein